MCEYCYIEFNNTTIYTNNTINNVIINDDTNAIHNESNVMQLLFDLGKKVQNIEK